MTQPSASREVVVAGVGLHPFGRFPGKTLATLAAEAVTPALDDAGVGWRDISIAYFGHVYYEGMSVGETALANLGLTGIPIVNVENACSSGSTAFWQAYWGITSGLYDLALAFGAEKVPSGPVTVTAEDSPDRYIGADHMMAGYALRMRRYMEETGAPATALAQVSVKARRNAAMNPYAHRKQEYSLEEVLQSRLIADPLTLYQCCPPARAPPRQSCAPRTQWTATASTVGDVSASPPRSSSREATTGGAAITPPSAPIARNRRRKRLTR